MRLIAYANVIIDEMIKSERHLNDYKQRCKILVIEFAIFILMASQYECTEKFQCRGV